MEDPWYRAVLSFLRATKAVVLILSEEEKILPPHCRRRRRRKMQARLCSWYLFVSSSTAVCKE